LLASLATFTKYHIFTFSQDSSHWQESQWYFREKRYLLGIQSKQKKIVKRDSLSTLAGRRSFKGIVQRILRGVNNKLK
jgi:hypothetical protein